MKTLASTLAQTLSRTLTRLRFGRTPEVPSKLPAGPENMLLAASVFTHAREGIMITDARANIVEVNEAFTRITGYERSEVLGLNPRLLQSGVQSGNFYATLWKTLQQVGHWRGEVWNRRKNGDIYAQSLTITAVRDVAGQLQNYLALFNDITTVKKQQKQLEHIAHYDALTDLPNRVLLADRLLHAMAQSQRRNQSLAVVYLDLDGFKAVNDQHGHDVGDQLLVRLSQRMLKALRDGDTLARIGGDEFVGVLVDLKQPNDCDPVVARLLQACAEPVLIGDLALRVSVSIGVTIYPQDGVDADQLMRHADQAMYQAKRTGKNRYHLFDAQQECALQAHREKLDRIRQALRNNEFVLYYQPKANMKTGAVKSVEALIRWQHPEDGLLCPSAFLPYIEEHPLSVELGEWVIHQALAQATAWRKAGLSMGVSVNIGVLQLLRANFAQRLASILAHYPLVEPHTLELDVREVTRIKDLGQMTTLTQACHQLGVGISLDNFGTGFFSLSHLKALPGGALKIDRSFVRDMLQNGDDLAIVKSVIGLAAAFQREVIAEGVETVSHGEMLLSLGCDLAQGYGISHPMPAEALPGWLADWRPASTWVN